MSADTPEVVYVLPDKMGGVFSYADNLLAHRRADGLRYAAVLTDNARDADARSRDPLPADRVATVQYSLPPENLRAVLRRLALAIPENPGVLVANGWIELALATVYDTGRAVVAINHGDFDFYYDLAIRHQDAIDAFVTYTQRMYRRLRELLPSRAESIFLLPYGVDIPAIQRQSAPGRLRVMYVGRLHRDKGVLELPAIDRLLRERGCDVAWTIQGTGPDEDALRSLWTDRADIRWSGLQPMTAVLKGYQSHDVLVMPCRHEGLPVALLEAGAAGVVPVISNLPSGIPEVVEPGVTGFRPEPGDLEAFADAVHRLDRDRTLLDAMSGTVRARVAGGFDASVCAAGYQSLYARWRELKRARPSGMKLAYGSRLDKAWIPNSLVKAIRSRGL